MSTTQQHSIIPSTALDGKLSSGLDAQVRVPEPAGNAQKGVL